MPPFVVPLDQATPDIDALGGKAASLAKLIQAGLPVPHGFVLTTEAYRRFVADNDLQARILEAAATTTDEPASLDKAAATIHALFEAAALPDELGDAVAAAYRALGGAEVAVRSSATAEDLPDLSFAGQQDTYLNVRGEQNVRAAVKRCWASLWTARAIGYRKRSGISSEDVALAVVVQSLVAADAAGVMFTANPVNGARDQIVINAAWGLGEAIVGGLVTPDTLVVDKTSGTIKTQDIANKALMTVPTADGTADVPVSPEKRHIPVLNTEQVRALSQTCLHIERLYGQPMDIEWALHGDDLAVLQARPITALPEPTLPLEWHLPDPKGRYARSSVIELLPDPVTPLFATLGLGGWNQAMQQLLLDLGVPGLLPENAIVTINDYAFYDIKLAASVPTLLAKAPRLLPAAWRIISRARSRWQEEARPRYAALAEHWQNVDLSSTPSERLLAGAGELVRVAADHYLTIQSGILPAAYMSELLFTQVYERLIRRPGDPAALTFMLGFDSAPIRAEKSLYDLAMFARSQPELAEQLERTPSANVVRDLPRSDVVAGWAEFRERFLSHLKTYGHAIYDLDFAKPLPVDEPAPLIEALKYFLSGQATNPHDRQQQAASAREHATRTIEARLRGPRRGWFRDTLAFAQRFAPLREDALADVGLGWPVLRRLLAELGQRLVAAGLIDTPGDVYWLRLQELRAALANAVTDVRPLIARRRAQWAIESHAVPPAALPIKGGAVFLGFDFTRFMPALTEQAAGDVIRGIGASPGQVTARARVVGGPDQFDRMRPGDILVAKITTPAWTPLFALASGIVTDVGGPLSHSSIVAREYHIPAVLGTGVATERIATDQTVTVDGDAGTVVLAHA